MTDVTPRTDPHITAGDRSVSQEWTISSGTDGNGEPTRELVVLDCHHTGRQTFVATLRRVTKTRITVGGRTFTSTEGMPLSDIRIHTAPVARFSARALASFGAEARGMLCTRWNEDAIRRAFGQPTMAEAEAAWVPPVTVIVIGADEAA